MSAPAFPHLLGAATFAGLDLRNRIALCPMGTNLGEPDGTVGDAQVAWYETRARGGVGTVIVGSIGVAYPDGSYDARQIAASDDAHLPGLRRLAGAVAAHGAASVAQLVHDGVNSLHDIERGVPLLVPSRRRPPAPDELSAMVTDAEAAALLAPFGAPSAAMTVREATDDDLEAVIAAFASAAERVRRAGFDAIELHAGHGYLIDAFLSPATNRRTDDWGGTPERRALLMVEVVRAVRRAVGPDVALWARVTAQEVGRDPGQTVEGALVAMGMAVDAGLDALHVTAYGEPMSATGITDGHTPHRPGALLGAAARTRAELGVPVIAFGRLTPEAAEEALARGDADLVAMGRPLIADPDLPAKLAAGRRHLVRPCAYQYRCIGSIFLNDTVRCSVNPDAGHEGDPPPTMAPDRHRVVVAGAGPAGLEAARRLALGGHHVEVWDRADRTGGRLRDAEAADPDLAGLADWLEAAALDAGVRLVPGRAATAEGARAVGADLLVWAVGGSWTSWPGGDRPPGVLGLDDLGGWLAGGDPPPGATLAIVGGGKAAVSIARRARRDGCEVVLVAPTAVIAPELGLPGRFRAVADARAEGIETVVGADRISVQARTVRWVDPDGSDRRRDVDAIAAIGLAGTVPPGPTAPPGLAVHVIGDASGTAGLEAALSSARALATSIGHTPGAGPLAGRPARSLDRSSSPVLSPRRGGSRRGGRRAGRPTA